MGGGRSAPPCTSWFDGFRPPNRLKFFFMAPCVSPLHSIFSDHVHHVHMGTCTCLFMKACAQQFLWNFSIMPFFPSFLWKTKFSKLNFSGFRPPNRLKFFFMAPCVSTLNIIFSDHMPHVHLGTFTCLFMKNVSQKTKKMPFFPSFLWKTKYSKLNFSGFRPPNRLNFFFLAPCVSPLRGCQHATCPTCTWARSRAFL